MNLFDRWANLLEQLRRQGRRRALTQPAGIDFTSNDYLGYGSGARGPNASPQAASSLSGMASRLLRGHHESWEEVETRLAAWHGCAAALVMNTGYVANEGLLSTIIEPADWVASDQFNHASIIDGLRLSRAERFIFAHNDLNHLETGLKAAAQSRFAARQLFIHTESLFSMEGDRAPLVEMVELAEQFDAHLIVDEAHATGCFGASGAGLVDALGLRARVLATVHTGGKALGVMGAYICGSRPLKELLINRCRHLIFTTALPPTVAGWWLQMLPFAQADESGRAALHHNAQMFRRLLAEQGIESAGQDFLVPLIIGPDQQAIAAAALLQEQGLDIRAIRPPTVPPETSRLRISIHANHDKVTLERTARTVANTMKQIQQQR